MDKEGNSVYSLITRLCVKLAQEECTNARISQSKLVKKLRSRSFELLLKKSDISVPKTASNPVLDLLSYYFVSNSKIYNIADFKACNKLKEIIEELRTEKYGKITLFEDALNFIFLMKDSIPIDSTVDIFQHPFTLGLLDRMLPRPAKLSSGPAEPYQYYPDHVFQLPYSLDFRDLEPKSTKSFRSFKEEDFHLTSTLTFSSSHTTSIEDRFFSHSPMSMPERISQKSSMCYENNIFHITRLDSPRDLFIPRTSELSTTNLSQPGAQIKEVYKAPDQSFVSLTASNIWDQANSVDKNLPDNIWELAAKEPAVEERRLIAMSSREVSLWREAYCGLYSSLHVLAERELIRHLQYLLIGVESSSFPLDRETETFSARAGLCLEGVSAACLQGYLTAPLRVATCYRRLYTLAFPAEAEPHAHLAGATATASGVVYESARNVVKRYLLEFQVRVSEIFEVRASGTARRLPTLLQILRHVRPLQYEIETLASIYRVVTMGSERRLPRGVQLMPYLYSEISMVTHAPSAASLHRALHAVCRVYFKFIERFIFGGELHDPAHEFFIRKDAHCVDARSKRYWDRGFYIAGSGAGSGAGAAGSVPAFLRGLAPHVLLCGKSLRLLKLVNAHDPLVILMSSDYPAIKCCTSFEQLERQQHILDLYRTRCLYVSGETVTFERLQLQREAQRKAFAEMATLKQQETMDKIIAERKRLARLIAEEKQHSLKILEAAIAESNAAKNRAKQRDKYITELEKAASKARDQTDAIIKEDEQNKIIEYYSKLNMEVEKQKAHTEWKIKRLQLDQSRMQLLSSEERKLKREKLELEHLRNGESLTSSLYSIYSHSDSEQNKKDMESYKMTDSVYSTQSLDAHDVIPSNNTYSVVENDIPNITDEAQESDSKNNNVVNHGQVEEKTSKVYNLFCKVAKSIFGESSSSTKSAQSNDNSANLDSQGNMLLHPSSSTDINKNMEISSSKEIKIIYTNSDSQPSDSNLYDNAAYLQNRLDALNNKKKVLAHEFGKVDAENNLDLPCDSDPDLEFFRKFSKSISLSAFEEAKRNKLKVLGAEFGLTSSKTKEPVTTAQKEAVVNRAKVLGTEYNLPPEVRVYREPQNRAQEEAIENRNRAQSSNIYEGKDSPRRSALTLDLKPNYYAEDKTSLRVTPSTGLLTPGDVFPRLDLETPTTADIVLGPQTTDDVTPETETKPSRRSFLNEEGFKFPTLVVEETDTPDILSPEKSSPSKVDSQNSAKYKAWNIAHDKHSFEDFDPFGVKGASFSTNFLTDRLVNDTESIYTNPLELMKEASSKPYKDIFGPYKRSEPEDEDGDFNVDNIATLTVCLQRSVMLPLSYQLELVNNSILTYFLVNLDMYDHLKSLTDYFFLMDGEFSRSICQNLFAKLVKTVNPEELLNFGTLHSILDKALGSSLAQQSKLSERLSFTMCEPPLSFQHSSPDVLQCLALGYSVAWPLNVVLSPEALARYARVFQFLVKMRRIAWLLAEDFQALKLSAKMGRGGGGGGAATRSRQYRAVQTYRHTMAALVRALDSYVATTCLRVPWSQFEAALRAARTLDQLHECHVAYVKTVLFRCLLNRRSAPVLRLLNDIFTVIIKFSRVLGAKEWVVAAGAGGPLEHPNFAQLQELFGLFEKLARYLHKTITRLMECGYQPHLAELLIMTNLNGYYAPPPSPLPQHARRLTPQTR